MQSTQKSTRLCLNIVLLIAVISLLFNVWYFVGSSARSKVRQSSLSEEGNCRDEVDEVRMALMQVEQKRIIQQQERQRVKGQLKDVKARIASISKSEHATTISSEKEPTIEIKVLTFDRLDAVERCVKSLEAADYDGDSVELSVFVDHFAYSANMTLEEQKQLLQTSRDILNFLDNFKWSHGRKHIHYRQMNAHLQFQWIESFYPLDNDTYAFVVEDDMELSPFYYLYLKKLLKQYRYTKPVDPNIYGISLQKQKFVPGAKKVATVNNQQQPYLYKLIGTWGQLLFPEHWRAFRKYFDTHRFVQEQRPFLDGLQTDRWYQTRGERLWTPWIIRWANNQNYYNLYTNFNDKSLSISHRDGGVNFKKSQGADSTLIDDVNSPDFERVELTKELPPVNELMRFDYCFNQVPRGKIVKVANDDQLPDSVQVILVAENSLFMYNQMCIIENNVSKTAERELRLLAHFYTTNPEEAERIAYRGFNALLVSDTTLGLFLTTKSVTSALIVSLDDYTVTKNPLARLSSQQTVSDAGGWIYIGKDGVNAANIKSMTRVKAVAQSVRAGQSSQSSIGAALVHVRPEKYAVKPYDVGCVAVVCNRH